MKCVDVVEMFICLCELNFKLMIELVYIMLFELLVVVVLFVQVIDVGVNKVMCKLYLVVNMFVVIFVLGEDGLKVYISIIGLFNVKVKNVIVLC